MSMKSFVAGALAGAAVTVVIIWQVGKRMGAPGSGPDEPQQAHPADEATPADGGAPDGSVQPGGPLQPAGHGDLHVQRR